MDYLKPLQVRPKYLLSGDVFFYIPNSLVNTNDEIFLTQKFISQRKLFGEFYLRCMPEFFRSLGQDSGVMIKCFIPTGDIFPKENQPGDIDLLIIPYDNDQLILSKSLFVEVKVVRATYGNAGKSPNKFGFTQAKAMKRLGVPYVAVLHIVLGGTSPEDSWGELHKYVVSDSVTGRVEFVDAIKKDTFSLDVIHRAYGRLLNNCVDDSLGLAALCMDEDRLYFPNVRAATQSDSVSKQSLDLVYEYYLENYEYFVETRNNDP